MKTSISCGKVELLFDAVRAGAGAGTSAGAMAGASAGPESARPAKKRRTRSETDTPALVKLIFEDDLSRCKPCRPEIISSVLEAAKRG